MVKQITQSRIFSDSIVRVTEEYYTYETIRCMCGQWEADRWRSWYNSELHQDALNHAVRINKHRSLRDKRTRGFKYLDSIRKTYYEEYERDNPEPPRERDIFLDRLNGLS